MKVLEIIESAVINPDVSWVDHYLKNIIPERNIYNFADQLTGLFDRKNVEFDVVKAPEINNNEYDDQLSMSTGIIGAEIIGNTIVVKITKNALASDFEQFTSRLKQIIKHELIHKDQAARSKTGTIGSSKPGDLYYTDPHEIAAISAEIEDQLLSIESDIPTLIDMIKRLDSKLYQSDRFRLYAALAKENPAKFKESFNRILKHVVSRLTARRDQSSQMQRPRSGQE